jgi:hypothetical protein
MIRTVTYLLAGVLVTSTWIVKAEAQANGNPTGGNFAKEHPRRNEVNTRVDNQRARTARSTSNKRSNCGPMIAPLSSRSTRTSKRMAGI